MFFEFSLGLRTADFLFSICHIASNTVHRDILSLGLLRSLWWSPTKNFPTYDLLARWKGSSLGKTNTRKSKRPPYQHKNTSYVGLCNFFQYHNKDFVFTSAPLFKWSKYQDRDKIGVENIPLDQNLDFNEACHNGPITRTHGELIDYKKLHN